MEEFINVLREFVERITPPMMVLYREGRARGLIAYPHKPMLATRRHASNRRRMLAYRRTLHLH